MSRRWRLEPDEPQLAAGRQQPLLGLQQHAEAGARDVFELAAVERHRPCDLVEKRLRRRRLRGVKPAGQHHGAVRAPFDCEHALPVARGSASSRRIRAGHPQRDPALPAFLRVLVLDRIHHASNEVQPEPARLALLDRRVDVDVGRPRDVEGSTSWSISVTSTPPAIAANLDAHRRAAAGAVFDHVREQLFHRQVDGRQQSRRRRHRGRRRRA